MTDKYKAYHRYSRKEMEWLKAKGEWNNECKKIRKRAKEALPFE